MELMQEQIDELRRRVQKTVTKLYFDEQSIEETIDCVIQLYQDNYEACFKEHQEMLDVAKEYYKVLQDAKVADEARKLELKHKLDELSAPFSDNTAYCAFLEMERLAVYSKSQKKGS